ncbi:hypothetical protein [Treponema sp.]|uniref:hypothetical protein n=1 Tax=Treponema sp. TaxID=166 RepID=UPI0025D6552F|nr:hypothetical protein [Treponema sp.]MBR4321274.1 hypothetical protein [Treponema sp.]
MKKSILWLAGAAFSAFIFASCGSTKIAMQEHSPVAVFSIVGNSQVPWTADDPHNPDEAESDGVLSSMVNKLIDGQNPEIVTAVDRLDYADDSIRQIFPEMTGCEILSKDAVIDSEAYKDLSPSYFNLLASTKTATNYKDFTTIGAKKARIALEKIGAKSAIILNFTFQKKLLKGNKWNGDFCGVVTLKAKLLNSRGKEIINKTYEVQTSERTRVSSHKYDKNAFVATFNEAIDSAIRQFALEFVGTNETEAVEAVADENSQAQAIALPLPAKTNSAEAAAEEAPASSIEAKAE